MSAAPAASLREEWPVGHEDRQVQRHDAHDNAEDTENDRRQIRPASQDGLTAGSKTHGKRNDCWQGQRKPRPRPGTARVRNGNPSSERESRNIASKEPTGNATSDAIAPTASNSRTQSWAGEPLRDWTRRRRRDCPRETAHLRGRRPGWGSSSWTLPTGLRALVTHAHPGLPVHGPLQDVARVERDDPPCLDFEHRARLRVATGPFALVVQREAAEPAELDVLAAGQRLLQDLETSSTSCAASRLVILRTRS